jgi:hypothetical protein
MWQRERAVTCVSWAAAAGSILATHICLIKKERRWAGLGSPAGSNFKPCVFSSMRNNVRRCVCVVHGVVMQRPLARKEKKRSNQICNWENKKIKRIELRKSIDSLKMTQTFSLVFAHSQMFEWSKVVRVVETKILVYSVAREMFERFRRGSQQWETGCCV